MANRIICHRSGCGKEMQPMEGYWVEHLPEVIDPQYPVAGHLYCDECIEAVYRQAVSRAQRTRKGWLWQEATGYSIRQVLAREHLDEEGFLRITRAQGMQWWDEHGQRIMSNTSSLSPAQSFTIQRRAQRISMRFEAGQAGQALKEALMLFDDCRRAGDAFMEAMSCAMAGNYCIALGMLTHALHYLEQAEQLAEHLPRHQKKQIMPQIKAALGNTWRDLGMPDKALPLCQEALDQFLPQLRWSECVSVYLDMARTYMYKDQEPKAEAAIQQANELYRRHRRQIPAFVRSHLHMMPCLLRLKRILFVEEAEAEQTKAAEWKALIPFLRQYADRFMPLHQRLLAFVDNLQGTPQKTVGRYLETIWRISTAAQDSPSHMSAHVFMGMYAVKVEQNSGKAVTYFEKAIGVIDQMRGNTIELVHWERSY